MSFLWTVASVVIALLVVRISWWWYRWSNPKCNGKLPPGSMGFPIIGETLDFFKPHGFYEVAPFFKKRMLRYGPLFKTNIFGSNFIISTDEDVNFKIFRQENQSFTFTISGSAQKVFGESNVFLKHGDIHKHIKQITLHFLGSESLKRRMIGDIDKATNELLRSKATEGLIDAKDAVSSLIVSYMTPKMIGNLKPETKRKLIENYSTFSLNWVQSIFRLSTWNGFYKILKDRKEGIKMVTDVFMARKESKEKYDDFLGTLLEEMDKEDSFFDDETCINLIYNFSVFTQETTSTVTALVMKFLTENPKVLAELKKEHETIIQNRDDEQVGVSWEEYRHKMNFTNMVINESLRLANLALVMLRQAVTDVEINGYTIPAGWIVVITPSVVHSDPKVYENPFEFNPWRWEGKEVRTVSKTFMVFGLGMRQCAGAEFVRLQMATFIHYLVTYYDFTQAKNSEPIRTPLLHFPAALSFNISKSQVN